MHNNSVHLSTPAFVPTVFALVRKLFCLSLGLSEVILCAAMYVQAIEKGNLWFSFCVLACEEQRNRKSHMNYLQGFEGIVVICLRILSRFTLAASVSWDVIYNIVPGRLFLMWSECGDEKQQDVSHEPNAWQPARCARDAMSHGTQHLFPLGPIIATLRLRIDQPSSGVIGVACWWLHFPSATVWVIAKENVQFIGEWNAIT